MRARENIAHNTADTGALVETGKQIIQLKGRTRTLRQPHNKQQHAEGCLFLYRDGRHRNKRKRRDAASETPGKPRRKCEWKDTHQNLTNERTCFASLARRESARERGVLEVFTLGEITFRCCYQAEAKVVTAVH